MTEALAWLPASALLDVRTAEPIARALRDWSDKWLASGTLIGAPRWEYRVHLGDDLGFQLVSKGNGYRLLLRGDQRLSLASLLLGRELGDRECKTGHDRAIIQHLIDVSLAALTEALAGTLVGAPETADDWFALSISSDKDSDLMRLEASRSALVALVGTWTGLARPGQSPSERRASLADQHISLSGRIGLSRLSLAEIDAIDVGDVLTLDTPLSAPFDALINGVRAADAALSLAPGEEILKLQIERPASQW